MIELHIPAMHCGGCAGAVTRALQDADPAARVDVDLDQRRVRVESRLSEEAVTARLQEAGFPASPV